VPITHYKQATVVWPLFVGTWWDLRFIFHLSRHRNKYVFDGGRSSIDWSHSDTARKEFCFPRLGASGNLLIAPCQGKALVEYGRNTLYHHSFFNYRCCRLICSWTWWCSIREEVQTNPLLPRIYLTFHSLSSARFLKTIRGKTRQGHVVVKIFIKPNVSFNISSWVKQLRGISPPWAALTWSGERFPPWNTECLPIHSMYRNGESRIFNTTTSLLLFIWSY